MQKMIEKHAGNERIVSSIITKNDLKERFIKRTFNMFASIKKAFIEWKDGNFIELSRFEELMESWGFKTSQSESK